MKLEELFDKAGINYKPYARKPTYDDVFSLALDDKRETVRFWMPKAGNLEIKNERFSAKHNQVSFSVVEKPRKVTETIRVSSYDKYTMKHQPPEYVIRRAFKTWLPNGTRYVVKSIKDAEKPAYGSYENYYTVEVEAVTRQTTVHFLVGKDESKLFISALPKAANSVEDAHKILRPDGVTASTKRQGEWFFIPADDPTFDEKYAKNAPRRNNRWYDNETWTIGSSNSDNHRAAMVVTIKGKPYVKGLVYDTSGRHESFFLDKWHLVKKNRELPNAGQRNWD